MKGPKRGKKSISVDFSGVESGGRAVPDGIYFLTSVSVEEKESGEGNPYLAWEWKVADGKHKGATIYDNTSLQPQALWRLKTLLEVAGREVAEKAMELDLDDLVGLEIQAEITNEEYQGKQKPRVTNFLPYDTVNANAKTDDDNDGDDDGKPRVKKKVGGSKLKAGSTVKFTDDDGKQHKGVIQSIEDENATVDVKGEEWEIPLEELTAA